MPESSMIEDNRFQFHKGTIRTEVPEDATEENPLFQFHKGTIRTGKVKIIFRPSQISIP